MEKSFQPSSSSGDSGSSSQYLKQLNKLSHKISKPPISSSRSLEHHLPQPPSQVTLPPPLQPLPHGQQSLQPQPPVYNINKSEFRDIVQKLTGSAAHSTPPPQPAPLPILPQSKPPSSRLQRIRPPPLAHLANRPPGSLNHSHPNSNFNPPNPSRPPSSTPLSPLPPLPSVHAAAESPISAYMRYINSAPFDSTSKLSPLGFSNAVDQVTSIPIPTSPLPPFGCMSTSSTSSYNVLPLSPTVPVSPKWKGP